MIENYYTEENLSDNYIEYMSYLNGYESIDDMINKNAYDIIIPSVVKDKDGNEYKITEISGSIFSGMDIETYELFEENTRIKSVVIPEGIEKIGSNNEESIDFVFYGDFNLQSVSFPSSLKTIGNYVFYVSYISNIELPDSLEEIGEYAFDDNPLTSVVNLTGIDFDWNNIGIDSSIVTNN